jgi:hypothetical protein
MGSRGSFPGVKVAGASPPSIIEVKNAWSYTSTPVRIKHRYNFTFRSRWEVNVKGKVALVLNYAPRHGGILGEWRYGSKQSDLGIRWCEWSVSKQGESPRYPLDRRLGGPQSRSGHGV